MIKNKILVALCVLTLIGAVPVFAQDAVEMQEPLAQEAITTQDLGIQNVGLLPTSPFYFFKNWSRTVRKTFTFNPVKKAELEVGFVNERAAEIKKLEEVAPQNVTAVTKALLKYQKNVKQLKNRLEGLKETSENPNIDRLVNKFTDQSFKHQQLFDELKVKFEGQEDLTQALDSAQGGILDTQTIIAGKIDTAQKFKERVENAAANQKSEFKDLKAAEFIDRLQERVAQNPEFQKPEFVEKQKEFANLKEDLLLRFGASLEGQQMGGVGTSTVPQVVPFIKELPGDQLRRLKLLDEVREKVVNPELKSELNVARQGILENVKEAGLINPEDVKIRIEKAERIINEMQNLISAREGDVGVSVKQLLERAKFNLESAKSAFGEGNYGNAFGQATAASAAAENAYKQLTTTSADYQNIIDELKRRYDSLNAKVKASNIGEADNRLYSLLSDTEKQILELSQLAAQKAIPDKINSLIQQIKLTLSTIENFLTRQTGEAFPRAVEAVPIKIEGPMEKLPLRPLEPQPTQAGEIKPGIQPQPLPLKPTISPDVRPKTQIPYSKPYQEPTQPTTDQNIYVKPEIQQPLYPKIEPVQPEVYPKLYPTPY